MDGLKEKHGIGCRHPKPGDGVHEEEAACELQVVDIVDAEGLLVYFDVFKDKGHREHPARPDGEEIVASNENVEETPLSHLS